MVRAALRSVVRSERADIHDEKKEDRKTRRMTMGIFGGSAINAGLRVQESRYNQARAASAFGFEAARIDPELHVFLG